MSFYHANVHWEYPPLWGVRCEISWMNENNFTHKKKFGVCGAAQWTLFWLFIFPARISRMKHSLRCSCASVKKQVRESWSNLIVKTFHVITMRNLSWVGGSHLNTFSRHFRIKYREEKKNVSTRSLSWVRANTGFLFRTDNWTRFSFIFKHLKLPNEKLTENC